jgi:putative spermidine/putrescine transport system permease protein
MIIPVYAALERVPESLLEAAADLGARRWRAVRDIVLPLALPGVAAGSIFTFSLTLGDYITPILVGGAGSSFIGNVVYANVGIANNIPFAAALATVPVLIMAVYLVIAQRLGAFEAI